jgi:hypothetical protein
MELCQSDILFELNSNDLSEIDGGTFWGAVSGGLTVVSGVAGVVAGAGLCATPEPTGLSKFAGVSTIVVSVGLICSGASTIASNV